MSLNGFTSYPLKFRPLAKERIWGGGRLADFFQLNTEATIGEVWTLSGHENGTSICENGPLAGTSLSDIIAQYPSLYLGRTERDCFPLLIKFIHAEQDLSVQIHPDDAYAQKHEGDFGKTEAWYMIEAEQGAKINYGHTLPNREAYTQVVEQGEVEKYLQYRDVRADDFIFVPSRTLHAIMRGTMLIEIQQTSDVTYRVYDWNRVDQEGNARELHTDQAADVLTYGVAPIPDERKVVQQLPGVKQEHLIQCNYFTIDKWELTAAHTIPQGKTGQPDVLICATGEGTLIYRGEEIVTLFQGDTLLIPSDLDSYDIQPNGSMTLLRTYY